MAQEAPRNAPGPVAGLVQSVHSSFEVVLPALGGFDEVLNEAEAWRLAVARGSLNSESPQVAEGVL